MTIEITLASVRTITQQLIAERGEDYKYADEFALDAYPGCFYTPRPDHEPQSDNDHRRESGCLVGEILMRSGVSVRDLEGQRTSSDQLMYNLHSEGLIKFDSDARYFLSNLQYKQDTGYPWSAALAYAEHHRK